MGLIQKYPSILEFDKYISPDDEEYNFHTGLDKFTFGFEGFGLSPQNYLTQRGPFQHGVTLVDFFLQPRVIQLVHRRQGTSRENYWDNRADILNILRPNRQAIGELSPGVLRKTLPDGTKRDISVIISEGMRFSPRNTEAWDEFSFTEVIRFIAHDPTFFDPTVNTVSFSLDVGAFLYLQFPVRIYDSVLYPFLGAMQFSSETVNNTESITYTGTWETFPTITLTGPMQSPVIENVTTDEKIQLSYDVDAGEVITIDLSYGNKTIVNEAGTNLIGTLSTDSDLATFHIEPAPGASGGVNEIRALFSGANASSAISMSYYTRYIGI